MYFDDIDLDFDSSTVEIQNNTSKHEHIANRSSDLCCDVCHKDLSDKDSIVCCSALGAFSFRYCYDCYVKGLEPYNALVSVTACAGHFPSDVNPAYQKLARDIISGLNISETQFIRDVEEEIKNF